MQIKVKDTRMHKIPKAGDPGMMVTWYEVPVAEAELVFVECKPEEALFYQDSKHPIHYGFKNGLIKGIGKYLKPILISRTEKIEVGDWIACLYQKDTVGHINIHRDYQMASGHKCCFKILALPEHFSPKHLQAIVDGKMKEGDKVLVECDEHIDFDAHSDWEEDYLKYSIEHPRLNWIKLNSSNHITLHKKEEKMFSLAEVKTIALAAYKEGYKYDNTPFENWFEKNVK